MDKGMKDKMIYLSSESRGFYLAFLCCFDTINLTARFSISASVSKGCFIGHRAFLLVVIGSGSVPLRWERQ